MAHHNQCCPMPRVFYRNTCINAASFLIKIIVIGGICIKLISAEWDVSLIIQKDISEAIGGEAFVTQPEISVFDLKGLNKHTDLDGRVIATLEHTSVAYKDQLLGLENLTGDCHVNDEVEISFDLIGGDASFVGLCVNMAAVGYRIKYTMKDEYNITLAYLIGPEFTVSIGSPYQIGVVKSAEVVFGGITWEAETIVAVQDRGRNTVPSVNNGTVC